MVGQVVVVVVVVPVGVAGVVLVDLGVGVVGLGVGQVVVVAAETDGRHGGGGGGSSSGHCGGGQLLARGAGAWRGALLGHLVWATTLGAAGRRFHAPVGGGGRGLDAQAGSLLRVQRVQ